MLAQNKFQNENQQPICILQNKRAYLIKGGVLLILTASFFIYKFTFNMDLTRNCIYDLLHELTFPINQWIDKDPWLTVILIGQLMIDGFLCSLLVVWFIFMKNMALPNSMLVMSGIRTIAFNIFCLPFPEYYLWRAPPIPSIVPYGRTRDFFFSGHTGLAILLTMQVIRLKAPLWVQYLGYFMIAWMPFMLISTRAHYTIDVLAAPLFVKLSYHIHEEYKIYFQYVWSLPYLICLWIKRCVYSDERHGEDNNKLFDDNMA